VELSGVVNVRGVRGEAAPSPIYISIKNKRDKPKTQRLQLIRRA
jgi:hypothetical protein